MSSPYIYLKYICIYSYEHHISMISRSSCGNESNFPKFFEGWGLQAEVILVLKDRETLIREKTSCIFFKLTVKFKVFPT